MSGAVAAAIVARARRRITVHFTAAGATAKDAAVAFAPDGRVERRMFARMLAFGALKEAEPGLYWLDEAKLADFRKEALAHVLGILALAGFAAAAAIGFTG